MNNNFNFTFGNYPTRVLIQEELPDITAFSDLFPGDNPILMVCDTHTENLAKKILGERKDRVKLIILGAGEKSKTWESIETILRAGRSAGLGRDGLFIGVGGGVIGDLTAFAASIYMRGAKLCLVSTTLLGMVDASLGGKTGIDLLGLKNLAGTFFPAELVFIPLSSLDTLLECEWKSGMAELIKTAVLDSDEFLALVKNLKNLERKGRNSSEYRECLTECISRSIAYKGKIVEKDPTETGKERPLLNLGHTFGHALEGVTGFEGISHGEAVAWGMVRSCELGVALGVTPKKRAQEIIGILKLYGYETKAPHPLAKSSEYLLGAMESDKKQAAGNIRFIVPGVESAQIVSAATVPALEGEEGTDLVRKIVTGEYSI